jgi:spore germination protein KA
MFKWMKKAFRHLNTSNVHPQDSEFSSKHNNTNSLNTRKTTNKYEKVNSSIQKNKEFFEENLGKNIGIVLRNFTIGAGQVRPALMVAISGMVERVVLNQNILKPLMEFKFPDSTKDPLSILQESVLSIADIKREENLFQIANDLFTGKVALFLEGEEQAILMDAQAWEMRGIEQPVTETVIRGAREAFNEDLSTNITLLRRRVSSPNLRCEPMVLGTQTHTKISIAYIEGIVNKQVLQEVYRRLENINIEAIMESGTIEQLIEDAPFSLFPTIGNHERPDTVAAMILDGRVAVLVDGTPMVLTMPYLLVNNFQMAEDIYSRPFYTNLVRLLRVWSYLITTMLPGVFVAVQYYHPILIPFTLLVKLVTTRADVPFELYFEMIGMLLIFEIIRESGLRMPKPIGQAVSLVGALILGEAAVQAGLVGIPVVVTVALVGISSFPVVSLSESISVLRLLFVVVGASFGIFGILMLGMLIVSHLASIRSFGVPYSAPLFPIVIQDWKDAVLRFPIALLNKRPITLGSSNKTKQELGGFSGEGKRGKE